MTGDPRPLLRPPKPLTVRSTDVSEDTMCGIVLRQVAKYGPRVSVNIKRDGKWLPVSWDEQHQSTVAVAAALVHHDVGHQDRVAILSENRLEWLYVDFAIQAAGAVVVPIYASSSPDSVGQILADSGAVAVICSGPAQASKVAEVADKCPSLRIRVLFEGHDEGFAPLGDFVAEATAEDVDSLGGKLRSVRPDEVLTIIYTSGTTGVPKGVVLTHANVVAACRAIQQVARVREDDFGISFLPWAHVYERVEGIFIAVMVGASASIANDLDDIGGDLRAVRPTLMNGVPRLYEKMQEAILAQIRSAGGRRAALGQRAIDDSVELARRRRRGEPVPVGLRLRGALWRRLVIKRIRRELGGRARIFSSGGGPINIATLEFFDALGITITEGYGLTETSGGVAVNDPDAPRFGTVGRPIPDHEIRIAEDGEILVRGPAVMKGYFNNDEATREVLSEGWFHTGDIGELDADGYLRITDRKKDLIVTAGGKNIAPAPMEAVMMQDPMVERAVVIGDRRKYLVALMVPDFGALRRWAEANGVSAGSNSELVRDPRVVELYTGIAQRASERLARYETIKKVAVLDRDLEEQRGELTPTLKARRKVVTENFAQVIEELYA